MSAVAGLPELLERYWVKVILIVLWLSVFALASDSVSTATSIRIMLTCSRLVTVVTPLILPLPLRRYHHHHHRPRADHFLVVILTGYLSKSELVANKGTEFLRLYPRCVWGTMTYVVSLVVDPTRHHCAD
jgi:hypothetical protein